MSLRLFRKRLLGMSDLLWKRIVSNAVVEPALTHIPKRPAELPGSSRFEGPRLGARVTIRPSSSQAERKAIAFSFRFTCGLLPIAEGRGLSTRSNSRVWRIPVWPSGVAA
jgi:hypothetical protein